VRDDGAPPARTLEWVLARAGADEVLALERLRGGWTSAMHAVAVRGPGGERELVLRRMFREPWLSHAPELLSREAGTLRLLAGGPVPAPALVAADPRAEETDLPALLMSRLPGRLELSRADRIPALAEALAAIHRVRPPAERRPRPYQSWAAPEKRVVPPWAREPAVWRAAFAAIEGDPPAHGEVFLHRDFHPGNVLFRDGRVSGVVDWVETSWGPAELDLAHCCTGLAFLHGPPAAAAMRAAYDRARGAPLAPSPYWALIDAVGFLPDPEKVARPWRESGRPDLTAALMRRRFEDYVAEIVGSGAYPSARPYWRS
jgi:aminoglycoside phosphotransferase (APT) family kinase protein